MRKSVRFARLVVAAIGGAGGVVIAVGCSGVTGPWIPDAAMEASGRHDANPRPPEAGTPDAARPDGTLTDGADPPDVPSLDVPADPDGVTPDAPAMDAGVKDATTKDAPSKDASPKDAGHDAKMMKDASEGGGGEAGCSGATPVTLTVKNILVWCSVSVAGGAYSPADEQVVCVPPGTVSLAATPLSGFELGPAPWHDTAGDHGSGDPGTVSGGIDTTSVTVKTGAACVWICCPFLDGGGCPSTDQCP